MKINQPATGGAKQMMKKRTPIVSGGKAGTVGKYSSEGGRGDVGKRSYDGAMKSQGRKFIDEGRREMTSSLAGGSLNGAMKKRTATPNNSIAGNAAKGVATSGAMKKTATPIGTTVEAAPLERSEYMSDSALGGGGRRKPTSSGSYGGVIRNPRRTGVASNERRQRRDPFLDGFNSDGMSVSRKRR